MAHVLRVLHGDALYEGAGPSAADQRHSDSENSERRAGPGERALLESQPRVASVRALTPVEVVVMGRNVFTQLSRSMTPLRNILIDTVKQRDAAL